MTLSVVVNADDLGLHVAVRRAVERLAKIGCLTSASVLANGPDLDAVVKMTDVSLGAHLNVLRGRPLSPRAEVASLLRGDGCFLGSYKKLYARAVRGAVRLEELEREWSRQVERLLERGITLSHIDGEKHTHAWPSFFRVAARVAERFAIPFIRMPREPRNWSSSFVGQARVVMLNWWTRGAREALQGTKVRALDGVWGIADQGASLTARRFEAAQRGSSVAITARAIEIVCHPGLEAPNDPSLPEDFGRMRVRALWQPELRNLEDPAWSELFAARGWSLVSFDDLSRFDA